MYHESSLYKLSFIYIPYPIELKTKAITLRKQGYSLKEISKTLNIAKSTASAWLSDILLSKQTQEKLAQKKILGQYKAVLIKKKASTDKKIKLEKEAKIMLQSISFSKEIAKLCCALVWWCEGNKSTSVLRFTSSDITLVQNFLFLLRSAYEINETKFRALVHLHSYHNDLVQKEYWSKITKIPIKQFYRSFHKPNTGKRIHANYSGCLAISYYDSKIAKDLQAVYNAWSNHTGVG